MSHHHFAAATALATSCGSTTSSRPSTSASSFFSKDSASTAESDYDLSPRPLPVHATLPPLDPRAKAGTIRLPLQLPAPPTDLSEVDVSSLVVDDELHGAPVGFAVGRLRQLGAQLLTATTATCLHIPPGPTLAPYLQVSLPPQSPPIPPVFLPSHVFAIHSTDSPRTLLLPVHGLLWAASSPSLNILSSRPEKQPAHPSLPAQPRPRHGGETHLPVIELTLPSSAAFPLLQGWIYLRSPSLLLSSLLPHPPTPSPVAAPSPTSHPSSLSHLLNPSSPEKRPPPRHTAPSPQHSPSDFTRTLSALSSVVLLRYVHLVHGLWQDTVALQVSDEDLWRAMGVAWRILVAALALKEQERARRGTSPASGEEGEAATA
ncbi:hypothetical protein JCM3775_007502 [Rhodotorula graminis]|uniref:Clp1-like protein n=1 Tax=Rhodotorula graminis (strain WP1) TaxID=578459 RepID=A0A0P9EXL8_RHOGW|nr:uncharacterized protein RHOBADRAFT_47337 [Rhodotorula graminis WP1]KPV71887.1 hypothetical protein RHOBADRAFT_47337 [Rhodotorula graminis WP1]